jgi:DNA-binding MurR/RpiR family transcriptional regulator
MNNIISILFHVYNQALTGSSQKQISLFLLEHLEEIPETSSANLAKLCKVSLPTLIKFVHELGFNDVAHFKQITYQSLEICQKQLQGRYSLFDPQKSAGVLLPFTHFSNISSFMQTDTIDEIVNRIYACKRMVICGSLEMQSLFLSFQSNMRYLKKMVVLDGFDDKHPTQLYNDDFVCICSLTGRIKTYTPQLFSRTFAHPNHMHISQKRMDEGLWLEIGCLQEDFEANYLLLYYLDCIKVRYCQKVGL